MSSSEQVHVHVYCLKLSRDTFGNTYVEIEHTLPSTEHRSVRHSARSAYNLSSCNIDLLILRCIGTMHRPKSVTLYVIVTYVVFGCVIN